MISQLLYTYKSRPVEIYFQIDFDKRRENDTC